MEKLKELYKRKCYNCGETNYTQQKESMGYCRHCNTLGLKTGEKLEGEELRKANQKFEEPDLPQ